MALSIAKSHLAKLMATENLIVEQRNVQTAFFDVKERLLVIPTFSVDLSTDIQDVFISHEVSHALHTPIEGLIKAKELGLNASIVNVCEDARIERLIKEKYQGLKPIYSRGYAELRAIDFFGLNRVDFDEITIVDKVNLTAKLGFISEIEWTEEEEDLFEEVENTVTFDDVLEVSRKLQTLAKKQMEDFDRFSKYDDLVYGEDCDYDNDFDDMDQGDSDLNGNSKRKTQKTDNIGNGNEEDGEKEEGEGEEEEGGAPNTKDSGKNSPDAPTGMLPKNNTVKPREITLEDLDSKTYNSSEKNKLSFIENNGRDSIYIDVPEFPIDMHLVPYKELFGKIKSWFKEERYDFFNNSAYDFYSSFRKENESAINYMVKEFTLRKNARGRKKTREAKTGDLNANKLYSYKFNNDIFRRAAIVGNEKNHALVFYLDWSGSMQSILNRTIREMLCLVMFCRKLHIPFEVYAFTSLLQKDEMGADMCGYFYEESNKNLHEVMLGNVGLLNFLSYKMSNSEFIAAVNYLLSFDGGSYLITNKKQNKEDIYNRWRDSTALRVPAWLELSNTPLNHSILLSNAVAARLKHESKTDVVNNIFLTDGESHSVAYIENDNFNRKFSNGISSAAYTKNIYLRSKKHGAEMRFMGLVTNRGETINLAKFVKSMNDFRYFGFRLVHRYDVKEFYGLTENPMNWNTLKAEGCAKLKDFGFDAFYLVPIDTAKTESVDFEVGEKETAKAILKKFQTALKNKLYNKIFLQKFIEFIS